MQITERVKNINKTFFCDFNISDCEKFLEVYKIIPIRLYRTFFETLVVSFFLQKNGLSLRASLKNIANSLK